ncbi:MAG TPA: hypothetical protein VD790_11845 [Thermoleophilaceae bacterium]|nr:hypothetical protein [Thermoleophilaceae bacterium]
MESNDDRTVRSEEDAAAAEAAGIGGDPGAENPDPERQAVDEAGGGVAEGFEQAEEDLVENATHGDGGGDPGADAIDNEHVDAERSTAEYGEPDEAETPDA